MKCFLFLTVFYTVILTGCANTSERTMESSNNVLEETDSAYRYIKITDENDHSTYSLEPAGVKGKTIAFNSELLLSDIYKSLNEKCGFKKENLIETRIVSYIHPDYTEVWVFKDNLSERDDKTSAISVLLKQYPNNGGVDISLSNQCHAKPVNMVFSK